MRLRAALIVTVFALGVACADAAPPDGPSAAVRAARWIAGQIRSGGDGQAADAIIALRATGLLTPAGARARAAALRAGARTYATAAGPAAKTILGLSAAAAGNPRCAGTLDLLATLRATFHGGIYGTTAFDDGLALMALHALHEPIPPTAVTTLLRLRHGGGWTLLLRTPGRDDVASTSLILDGLTAAGIGAHDAALRSALAWLHTQRAPTGGYAMGRSDRSEGNTTGLALGAENAMGAGDPRAIVALIALQRSSGAVQFSAADPGSPLLATLDSVVGLSGVAPPLGARRDPAPGC